MQLKYEFVFVAACANHSLLNGAVVIKDVPLTFGTIQSAIYKCFPG